ncbi:hypothetical protein BpHYR1_003422 [Brachionus plicatilis]|uniref:Uncharacterized protein n=1 Tax=Brachionus plicatilis TaxID=10195 RepID=A0A3M7RCG1_BRAPC|nr:hypothetical protein BpHYR1_003422 [Brachionus plicatilis]
MIVKKIIHQATWERSKFLRISSKFQGFRNAWLFKKSASFLVIILAFSMVVGKQNESFKHDQDEHCYLFGICFVCQIFRKYAKNERKNSTKATKSINTIGSSGACKDRNLFSFLFSNTF